MLSVLKLRFLRLRDEYLIIIIMTVMALGLTAVFGASGIDKYQPKVLLIDRDNSQYSQLLIDNLKSDPTFQYEMSEHSNAIRLVDEGKALTAVVLGNGFGSSIDSGKTPKIEILKIKDDRYIFTLESLLSSISKKMITNIQISEITADYIEDSKDINRKEMVDKVYGKTKESWSYKKPIEVKREMIGTESDGSFNYLKHSMIGFTILFSTYTVVFSIGTILNDRKYNTWQRMLISPVSKFSLLGGSMVATYIVGIFQISILIIGGKFLFGIDWGSSILGIILIAAAFIFTMTCFGLLLSGVVKTYSQLSAITPVVLTSAAMLGGCMWPLEIITSKILLGIANFIPHKWAVEGIKKIAVDGYGFEAALMPSMILVGMGILFFVGGIKLVRFE